jgi:TetR/AcrR family transcriptional regulator, lmrAB and yxaGH operons repressor
MSDSSPRQRMIRSAALLMREHGVEGTSFTDVLEHSGAPRGSIYHHFPGGKAQLIEEATRWIGGLIAHGERVALGDGDPFSAIDAAAEFWSGVATDSTFRAGCPIAAATMGSEAIPAARAVAGEVFRSWEEPFAAALRRRGVPRARARSLATLFIAGMEGAVILTRAQQSLAPLERVHAELRAAVEAALADVAAQPV